MPEPKYVMAHIRIPIRVNPDNTTESLINHSTIDIGQCDELLPENGNNLQQRIQDSVKKYMAQAQAAAQAQSVQPKAVQVEEVVQFEAESAPSIAKKIGKNTTFKTYSGHNAHKFTIKRR